MAPAARIRIGRIRIGRIRIARIRAATAAALLVAGIAPQSPAHAEQPVRPTLRVQPPAQVRTVLPRAATTSAMPQAEMVTPDRIQAMTDLVLNAYSFEAEDWGERQDLGFTVQDMSGWGNQWSGNRQIFWNPQAGANTFKWDFSATGGQLLHVYLTAAPDYADLNIQLGCYEQVSEHHYELRTQAYRHYNGYSATVTRRQVAFNVALDPRCRDADMFRLIFTADPVTNRRLAGIDSIVVTR